MKTRLLCGLGPLLALPTLGQTVRADTSLLAATNSLHQHYASVLRDESGLYSGPAYVNYVRPGTPGHRFFDSDKPQTATITYGGIIYAGVRARYDLVRDQVVLSAQGGTADLSLVTERVACFTLGSHTFVRLSSDSALGLPERNFYDLLVTGPVRVLASRRKKYEETLQDGHIVSELAARTDYFLVQAGRSYPVSKLGDVLRQFPQQRAALRSYARANQLEFDEARREAAIVALVQYRATLGLTDGSGQQDR
ncbi:MAG: hypothetical protein ACRYFX_13710 [Janthinobacterium lividum]